MRSKLYILLLLTGLFMTFNEECMAQYATTDNQIGPTEGIGSWNWDGDIRQLRFNTFTNGFDYCYDDYLQYVNFAAVLTLKACGVPSRSTWGGLGVSAALSVGIYAALNNALKYTICRPRPDGSANNSFPSGHTGTAFAGAHMLHKEFGHINPWISIGGYTLATVTALSRIANDRHWMSDTIGGALLGIGSVELGYFLSDLIFRKSGKGIREGYVEPEFNYEFDKVKHYNVSLMYLYHFIVGDEVLTSTGDLPFRGSGLELEGQIPIVPACGVGVRCGLSSLMFHDGGLNSTYSSGNMYDALVGGYWNWAYPSIKWLEFETRLMIGGLYYPGKGGDTTRGGISGVVGLSVNFITGNNFKIRGIAEWQSSSWQSATTSWLHTPSVGFSAGFFF